ncbi:hypothetical protein LAZ67_8001675 [Cordylochernes scorpioides]|uniref:Retrovirus-related Pol polyprotein from transposon TNT 1-94 n=1 Tax=Cordylochernes scorpioides TaxID=51811 RepID=A0ABY6KU34_9ARAC|nr:hypothetical protein LAZ67_8001675 [Cordylochernes scorpioides]
MASVRPLSQRGTWRFFPAGVRKPPVPERYVAVLPCWGSLAPSPYPREVLGASSLLGFASPLSQRERSVELLPCWGSLAPCPREVLGASSLLGFASPLPLSQRAPCSREVRDGSSLLGFASPLSQRERSVEVLPCWGSLAPCPREERGGSSLLGFASPLSQRGTRRFFPAGPPVPERSVELPPCWGSLAPCPREVLGASSLLGFASPLSQRAPCPRAVLGGSSLLGFASPLSTRQHVKQALHCYPVQLISQQSIFPAVDNDQCSYHLQYHLESIFPVVDNDQCSYHLQYHLESIFPVVDNDQCSYHLQYHLEQFISPAVDNDQSNYHLQYHLEVAVHLPVVFNDQCSYHLQYHLEQSIFAVVDNNQCSYHLQYHLESISPAVDNDQCSYHLESIFYVVDNDQCSYHLQYHFELSIFPVMDNDQCSYHLQYHLESIFPVVDNDQCSYHLQYHLERHLATEIGLGLPHPVREWIRPAAGRQKKASRELAQDDLRELRPSSINDHERMDSSGRRPTVQVPTDQSGQSCSVVQVQRNLMLLIEKGLWDVMFKDEDTQDTQLKAQKDRALAVIALSINTEHQIHIIDCSSPQDAWKNLEQVFEPKSRSRILQLKKQFVNIKLQTGAEVDDQDIAYSMLSGLPDSFDTLVMSFGNVEDSDFTSNKVRNTLLTEYERRSAREGASSGLGEALNFSKDDTRKTTENKESSINRDYKADKSYSRKKDSFKSPSENMLMAFNAVSSEDEFILDSGATHHVYCERQPTSRGSWKYPHEDVPRYWNARCHLERPLFVPQAKRNLLSVSQAEDKGKHIKICNYKARVFSDNRVIRVARNLNGLYIVRVQFHYTRDKINSGDIVVQFVNTKENMADIQTKTLKKLMHRDACFQMNLKSQPPVPERSVELLPCWGSLAPSPWPREVRGTSSLLGFASLLSQRGPWRFFPAGPPVPEKSVELLPCLGSLALCPREVRGTSSLLGLASPLAQRGPWNFFPAGPPVPERSVELLPCWGSLAPSPCPREVRGGSSLLGFASPLSQRGPWNFFPAGPPVPERSVEVLPCWGSLAPWPREVRGTSSLLGFASPLPLAQRGPWNFFPAGVR